VETGYHGNPIYESLLGSSALSPPCFPLQKQGCGVVKLTGRLSQGSNVAPKNISHQHAWTVGEENGTMNCTKYQIPIRWKNSTLKYWNWGLKCTARNADSKWLWGFEVHPIYCRNCAPKSI
jgi:hypothetical protein